MSIPEAQKYFDSNSARECVGTEYCYARGAYRAGNDKCWWWLRTPGDFAITAAYVVNDGAIYNFSYSVYYGMDGAVRPALWVDLGI